MLDLNRTAQHNLTVACIAGKRRLQRTLHHKYLLHYLILLTMLMLLSVSSQPAYAEELNCLICHKHRGLSRIDEDGKFRLFYINNELFQSGPHRRNACKDCHQDIDRIPHNPAKKVDCTQECHVIEPSGKRRFSHKPIAETLAKSVHGKLDAEGKPKQHQEDFPVCKDCHDQPLYRPIAIYKGEAKHGISQRSITRCKACHKSGNFAKDFYEHVTTRLHKTRFSKEIVTVCAKCHQDPGFRKRHDLDDVVKTYKETFHGKLVFLGSERTADCIDCHVVEGENNHLIEAKTVPTSAIHKNNVGNTCRASDCHVKASPQLAGFQTHVTYDRKKYPLQFYMLIFFKALMAFILYFFLTMIFLELLRRLFPSFSFKKDNVPHHHVEPSKTGKGQP